MRQNENVIYFYYRRRNMDSVEKARQLRATQSLPIARLVLITFIYQMSLTNVSKFLF